MHQYQVPARSPGRTLRVDQNLYPGFGLEPLFLDGKAVQIETAFGEVPGYREEVWVANQRSERLQPTIVSLQVVRIASRHRSFGLPAEIFGQNDGFGQVAHRAPQTAALIAQAQVRFLFRDLILVLQNTLGALHQLARLELTLHLLRLFHQTGVLFGEHRAHDGPTHLLANEGNQPDLVRSMIVRFPVMHVDDAHHLTGRDQRNRQERFIRIFHEGRKSLEPIIRICVGGQSHNRLVLHHPPGDAFPHGHSKVAEVGRVRNLRSAENDVPCLLFDQVDEAGIAVGHLHGQADDLPEHLVQGTLGTNDVADAVKKSNLRLHNGQTRHNPHYRGCARRIQSKFWMAVILLSVITLPAAEPKWVKLRSPNFELLSNAGAGSGREVLRRMEQIRHVFETRTRRQNLTPLPVRIFVFRSEIDFRPYQVNESAAGYYQAGDERDYIAMQVNGSDLYRVVFHEYVHLLMRHAQVHVPVWFNEGTAEVYSTTELSGNEIRIGDLIPAHIATLRTEKVLDISTLLAVDHRSPWYNEREKTSIFYAQSWALVHMLNFSPDYQPGMPNFLSMLFSGEDPARALQQAFGKSPSAVLNDLTAYIRRDRFAGVRFAAPKLEGLGKIPAEPVKETESEMALADLLLALRRPEPAEIALLKLARAYPDDPDVEAALADVAIQRKEDNRAKERYERAIRLGSKSARLRYEYAMVLRELNAGDDAIMKALRDALQLDPKLFDARYLLGYTLLKTGKYGAAIDELRIASDLHPYRSPVWEHLALACHYAGRRDEARAAAAKARKYAASPEEAERAEATLRLVETSPDSVVQRRAPEPVTTVDAAPRTARAEGLLTQIDCLGGRARLHVATGGRRVFLLVDDPGKVVLRNAGGVWTEFTCGVLPGSRRVLIDYRPNPNASYGTAGEVAAIEFR